MDTAVLSAFMSHPLLPSNPTLAPPVTSPVVPPPVRTPIAPPPQSSVRIQVNGVPLSQSIGALSDRDIFAFETYAPIRIGYRFSQLLSVGQLCDSLHLTVAEFPFLAGKVVNYPGPKPVLHSGCQPVSIQVTLVAPNVLEDTPTAWRAIIDRFPLYTETDDAGSCLLKVVLLRSADGEGGCVLILIFDHVTGDIATVARVVEAWARNMQQMGETKAFKEVDLDLSQLTPIVLDPAQIAGMISSRHIPGHSVRRFQFPTKVTNEWKDKIAAHLKSNNLPPLDKLTVNDLLLAQTAISVAPFYYSAALPHAYIGLQTDIRGRGLPADFLGNASCCLEIAVSWAALMSQDVPRTCREIKESIAREFLSLSADPHRAISLTGMPLMFSWNSWARAATPLLSLGPRDALTAFHWLNIAGALPSRLFVVVPITIKGGGVAVHGVVSDQEAARLLIPWASYEIQDPGSKLLSVGSKVLIPPAPAPVQPTLEVVAGVLPVVHPAPSGIPMGLAAPVASVPPGTAPPVAGLATTTLLNSLNTSGAPSGPPPAGHRSVPPRTVGPARPTRAGPHPPTTSGSNSALHSQNGHHVINPAAGVLPPHPMLSGGSQPSIITPHPMHARSSYPSAFPLDAPLPSSSRNSSVEPVALSSANRLF